MDGVWGRFFRNVVVSIDDDSLSRIWSVVGRSSYLSFYLVTHLSSAYVRCGLDDWLVIGLGLSFVTLPPRAANHG